MAMHISKDQKINISISTIAAIIGSLAATVAGVKPFIESALAGEIKEQIAPLRDAMEIQTVQNIRNLQNSISAMNFKKEMCQGVPNCWTALDQQALDQATDDLRTARQVLESLRDAR